MASSEEVWKPGSFTKNFSWGERDAGLLQLHESIRIGFDHTLKDLPRAEFRRRIRRTGRVDYIPANFPWRRSRDRRRARVPSTHEQSFASLRQARSVRFQLQLCR